MNIAARGIAIELAPAPLDEARRAFEKNYLVRILTLTGGNVTQAARMAGRNRTEFYRLLERHALSPKMFKTAPTGSATLHDAVAARAGGDN